MYYLSKEIKQQIAGLCPESERAIEDIHKGTTRWWVQINVGYLENTYYRAFSPGFEKNLGIIIREYEIKPMVKDSGYGKILWALETVCNPEPLVKVQNLCRRYLDRIKFKKFIDKLLEFKEKPIFNRVFLASNRAKRMVFGDPSKKPPVLSDVSDVQKALRDVQRALWEKTDAENSRRSLQVLLLWCKKLSIEIPDEIKIEIEELISDFETEASEAQALADEAQALADAESEKTKKQIVFHYFVSNLEEINLLISLGNFDESLTLLKTLTETVNAVGGALLGSGEITSWSFKLEDQDVYAVLMEAATMESHTFQNLV